MVSLREEEESETESVNEFASGDVMIAHSPAGAPLPRTHPPHSHQRGLHLALRLGYEALSELLNLFGLDEWLRCQHGGRAGRASLGICRGVCRVSWGDMVRRV